MDFVSIGGLDSRSRGWNDPLMEPIEHLLMVDRVDAWTGATETEPAILRYDGDHIALLLDDGDAVVFMSLELAAGVLELLTHQATGTA